MPIRTKDDYSYAVCDQFGCTTRSSAVLTIDLSPEALRNEVATRARQQGWEVTDFNECFCPTHRRDRVAFNLRRFLRQANYEGAQGLFAVQRRAWNNCIKKHLDDGKGMQAAWEACRQEYQESGNETKWAADQLTKSASCNGGMGGAQAQMGPYWELLRKYRKQGKTEGEAVNAALATLEDKARRIPGETRRKQE